MTSELTEKEFTEHLKEFVARKSEFFNKETIRTGNVVKDIIVFKCPKCGFTDEIMLRFREE